MQKVFWFRISTFILDYLAHKMFFSVKLSALGNDYKIFKVEKNENKQR